MMAHCRNNTKLEQIGISIIIMKRLAVLVNIASR